MCTQLYLSYKLSFLNMLCFFFFYPFSDNEISVQMLKPEQPVIVPVAIPAICLLQQVPVPSQQTNTVFEETTLLAKEKSSMASPSQLAVQLMSVALEGLTDDELSDSGGEGMYRERDEFVVRNEDIESLKVRY